MADLLTVEDLEKAKKHDTFHSEVITGKEGGLSTGADIDYATNAVTGQVQKTLPKTIDDLDWTYVGLFADGVTFTDKTDFAVDAVGTQWIYTGSLPFSATAGTVPSEPTYQAVHVKSASAISNENGGSVQDFIDSFALKIFQSPTDNLTKVSTFAGGVGVVYEVRKTSDNSLATIYSDAAGTTEIAQDGTSNVSDSAGVVEFYIENAFVELTIQIGTNSAKLINNVFIYKRKKQREYLTIAAMVADTALAIGDIVTVGERPQQAHADSQVFRIVDFNNTYDEDSPYFKGYLLSNGLVASPVNSSREGQASAYSTHILDMRAKALKCTGWIDGEAGGVTLTTAIAQANTGDTSIQVADISNFIPGQLITYQDWQGLWKSAVVQSKGGNTLNLKTGVETAMLNGATVVNFYNNSSHPNYYGYSCIADYGIIDSKRAGKLISRDFEDLFEVSGTVKTLINTNSPSKPPAPYYSCTSGALRSRVFKDVGKVSISCIAGTQAVGTINMLIFEKEQDGAFYAVKNTSLNCNSGVGKLELDFASASGSEWYVQVSSTVDYDAGAIEVREWDSTLEINNGKHVLLGDSWFAISGIMDRLDSVLPSANFVNKGVGGNTSQQLLDRFDADVTPERPDYVWLMCGTNDNGQSVAVQQTNINMKMLLRKINDIGAIPLLFSPWVGYEPFFDASADLYNSNYLRESKPIANDDVTFSYDIDIAAGEEKVIYIGKASDRDYIIKESIQTGVASVDIRAGFTGGIGFPVSNVTVYETTELVDEPSEYKRIESLGEGNPRQKAVSVKNDTAGTVNIIGTMTVGSYL